MHSLVLPHRDPKSTSTLREQPGVLVVRKHHVLVRLSHWLNIPLLAGLILSGISIYWASPIYQHEPDPITENTDWEADIGAWICAHVPGLHHYSSPPDWIYNHMSFGPGMLGLALRLHWLCAYLFMLNGAVYVVGLVWGGGWRSLLPRRTDLLDALRMFRYYVGFPFAKLARRQWPHPVFNTKYNALQRAAYFSVPVAGLLSVATGWAMHKPMQLHWLAALFGGYNAARVWHFWLMWIYIQFVVPHVILVFADGWDTLRSMIVGWSTGSSIRRPAQMNDMQNCDDSSQLKDIATTGTEPGQEKAGSPGANTNDANPSVPSTIEKPINAKNQVDANRSPSSSVEHELPKGKAFSSVVGKHEGPESPEAGTNASPSSPIAVEKDTPETIEAKKQSAAAGGPSAPSSDNTRRTEEADSSVALEPVAVKKPQSFLAEQPLPAIEMAPRVLRYRSRRDFLVFGVSAMTAVATAGLLLPQEMLTRLGVSRNMDSPGKEWFLNRALRIDDDVAEALYSANRRVPTYTKAQITPLKNNYNGSTPDPSYISGWKLTLAGLASGLSLSLDIQSLLTRFSVHEQITRLVCVEGWSAIAWWAGLRFDDLLHAYPPMSQAKWARVESSVNLDASGNPDPYFMSLDLATARHPQTLLATHFNGQPLTVVHGAPIRLLVPVKLGLKNVKAITRITYLVEEPRDYWAERGYSRYDGI